METITPSGIGFDEPDWCAVEHEDADVADAQHAAVDLVHRTTIYCIEGDNGEPVSLNGVGWGSRRFVSLSVGTKTTLMSPAMARKLGAQLVSLAEGLTAS
jgi:hypothetical protein